MPTRFFGDVEIVLDELKVILNWLQKVKLYDSLLKYEYYYLLELHYMRCLIFLNHFYGISYFRCIGNLFMYTSFLYCKNLCWITIRTFTQIKSSVVGMFYLQSMTYIKYWIGSVKFSFRPLQENTVSWVTRFGTRITYFKDVLFHS